MYTFTADGPRTVTQAVIYLVGGICFGLLLWVLIRSQERRLFGDLTDAERAATVQAVRSGRPPADPRLRDAAARLAGSWTKRAGKTIPQLIIFGLFLLLSVYLGVAVNPWHWLGVLFWPAVAWLSIRSEQRHRRMAESYLRAAG